MLMELYRDIMEDPRLRKGGLRITVGDDGNGSGGIKLEHSSTGGHGTGDAFDATPIGGVNGGYFTKEYIYTMYTKMYENMLIAHHDPRIIRYFETQLVKYRAAGDAEMVDYYQRRLHWAHNPFARQYYEFIYEPFGHFPAMKDEVIQKLMNEYGLSRAEVDRFMELKFGDQGKTNGTHFHIWPPAEDRYWRTDPTSYIAPEKRDTHPILARS
jgi:hypothetical protein